MRKKIAPCIKSAVSAAVAGLAIVPAVQATVRINEIMVDAPGTNSTQDFIELKSSTGGVEDVTGLTLLGVEGDSGTPNGRGNIDTVLTFSGPNTGTNGLFVRHSFSVGPSPTFDGATVVQNSGWGHENAAITYILVSGFTGAVNTDIDANDDGVVDNTPWTSVIDSVGLLDNDTDADKTYGAALGGSDFNAGVQGSTPNVILRDPSGVMHAAQVTGAVGGPYTVNRSDSLAIGYQLSPGNANPANTVSAHAFIGATGSNWSNTANWTGAVAPSVIGDIATLDGGGGQTINLDTNVTLSALNFNGGGQTVAAGGGTITMDATGTPTIGVAYGNVTIAAPIVINKDTTISVGRAQSLTLSNTLTGAFNLTLKGNGTIGAASVASIGSGTQLNFNGGILKTNSSFGNFPRNMDVTGAGGGIDSGGFDSTFSGVISGSTTNSFIKNGAGVVTLTNTNTTSAPFTINGGALRIINNAALGTSAGLTFIAGGTSTGTLQLDGANAPGGSLTINDPISIEGKTGGGGGNTVPHVNNISGNNSITTQLMMVASGTWYNIGSDSGKLTLTDIVNPTNATARTVFFRGAGSGELTGGIFNTGTGTGIVTVSKQDAGTWTIGNSTYAGSTIVNGGTLILKTSLTNSAASSVVAVNSGKLQLAPLGTRIIRTGLVTTTGGVLDLTNNKLITTNAVGTATGGVYDGTSGQIQSGRNGGAWNGTTGIITSQTQALNSNFTTLGTALGSEVKGIAFTATGMWGGQTVTGSDALVMYTYGGDANLDGKINVDDYTRIDFNVPLGVAGWYNGDFNYDGKINVDDYTIIDFNVGIQGPAFPTGAGDGLNGTTAVPEPASLSLVAMAGLGLLGRRRQRRSRSIV